MKKDSQKSDADDVLTRRLAMIEDDSADIVADLIKDGDRVKFCAGLAGLGVRVASGLPMAGAVTEALLTKAFESSADKVVRKELEALLKEETNRNERSLLVAELVPAIESLLADAVVQIIRSQYASVSDMPPGLNFRSESMNVRREISLGLMRGRSGADVLAIVPASSMVDPVLISRGLVLHFAARHPDTHRLQLIMDAISLRRAVDDNASVPTIGEFPTRYEDDRAFWRQAFDICCRYGSRMVAAVLWQEFDAFDTSVAQSVHDDYQSLWAHLTAGTAVLR